MGSSSTKEEAPRNHANNIHRVNSRPGFTNAHYTTGRPDEVNTRRAGSTSHNDPPGSRVNPNHFVNVGNTPPPANSHEAQPSPPPRPPPYDPQPVHGTQHSTNVNDNRFSQQTVLGSAPIHSLPTYNDIHRMQQEYVHIPVKPVCIRNIKCPISSYLENQNCTWVGGSELELMQHLNNCHPNNTKYKANTENVKKSLAHGDKEVQVVFCEGQAFVFHLSMNYPWLYMGFQLIGTQEDANNWVYRIKVFIRNDRRKKLSFTERCTSNEQEIMEVFASGRSAAIPVNIVQNYIKKNNGDLTFSFSVYKYIPKNKGANN